MNYRDFTFELSGGEIELELQWSYYHDPGVYHRRPEDCYPEETEGEVLAPVDLAARVRAFAESMIPIWIKEIESQCMDMELDDLPAEWAEADKQDYYDSQAD